MKATSFFRQLCFAAISLTASIWCSQARAADTLEPFDPGASDVEMYVGYDGFGLDKSEHTVFGETVLGYGLHPRLSAHVGMVLEGNDAFADGISTHHFGVMATALDSDHVDLDLVLDVSSGGPDRVFELRPALELNFDSDPEMQGVGVYLRAPFPIYGRNVDAPVHRPARDTELSFELETALGIYATLAERHQLLLEYNMGFHPEPGDDERSTEVGGAALGYNVQILDDIELINQLFIDIPQSGEDPSFGMMVGFIATVPAGGQ